METHSLEMTPEEFISWRKSLGLNRIEAAAKLGMSRNSVTKYENGAHRIPNYIALACAALARGLEPWQAKEPPHA